MQCPWDWKQHGQSGKWVSGLLPHLADCVDDMAFVHSLHVEIERAWPGHVHAEFRLYSAGFRAWEPGSRMAWAA